MKKNNLFHMIFLTLLVSTISAAYYSATQNRSEIVFAQGAFGVSGCYQRFESGTQFCNCEGGDSGGDGSNDSADYGYGTGNKGRSQESVTCEANGLRCSTMVGVERYNFFCDTFATPTPTPIPIPTPTSELTPNCDTSGLSEQCHTAVEEYCRCQEFYGTWQPQFCNCWYESPIVIDIQGNGFNLTNAEQGVQFDFLGNGTKKQLAWTSADSDDAWLVLDRNGNNLIDDGTELFGNLTPQPQPPVGVKGNGFLALAEYDKSDNGGNGDGVVNNQDSIFADLRLWKDANQNGISEPEELHSLRSLNVAAIELDYKESKQSDEHGNLFRYRAKVKDKKGAQVGRWAWDVFLVTQQP